MKFMKILCHCGYKTTYNKDLVVACPEKIFEKYAKEIEIKGFKGESSTKELYCEHRHYGGPTSISLENYTRKEYIKLTNVYWWCGASTDKKKVILK